MSRREPTEATEPSTQPSPGRAIAPVSDGFARMWGDLLAVHMNGLQRWALLHRSAFDEMRRSESLLEVATIQATVQRALLTDWMEYAGDLARVLTKAPPRGTEADAGDATPPSSGSLEPVVSAMAEPVIQAWEAAALQPFAFQPAAAWRAPVADRTASGDRPESRAKPGRGPAARPVAAARGKASAAAKGPKKKAPRRRQP